MSQPEHLRSGLVNLWRDLESGPDVPEVVNVIVEVPKGSRNKYEYDEETGTIRLNRVLYSSIHYPGDYGLIPQTLYDDGDPLDILENREEAVAKVGLEGEWIYVQTPGRVAGYVAAWYLQPYR